MGSLISEELPPNHRIRRHYGKMVWRQVRGESLGWSEVRYKVDGGRHSRFMWIENPHTKLVQCELCGVWSTPKRVNDRNDLHGWNFSVCKDFNTASKTTLCMSCCNKVRAKVRRENEAKECRKLIKQLQGIIKDERKNQEHR